MEAIYSHLTRVGMTSRPSNESHSFNIRNSTSLFILGLNISCAMMYLIYGRTTNLKEYADSIYSTITVMSAASNFAFVNWKMAEIFLFLDNLENVVKTSKLYNVHHQWFIIETDVLSFITFYASPFLGCLNSTLKTIYTQTSEKIKNLVETSYLALIKITPAGVTIPAFITSFVAYYTAGLGADAFELPFPMW